MNKNQDKNSTDNLDAKAERLAKTVEGWDQFPEEAKQELIAICKHYYRRFGKKKVEESSK